MKFIHFILVFGVVFSSCQHEKQMAKTSVIPGYDSLFDLNFTESEYAGMQQGLVDYQNRYKEIHNYTLENETPPALVFNPLPLGFSGPDIGGESKYELPNNVALPENSSEIAFLNVFELSNLIRTGKISSENLTRIYLDRLKKYGDTLQCVVTITEELALKQARQADKELAEGKYRGPLHGIPYGIKDLFSVRGYKTTWGAMPYKNQILDTDSEVFLKLSEAGAVCVAKLTLGALAMGDVWYGGVTKNPWNLKGGSSGSSAGSASAAAAGLVAFSIGTETWGSIVSPSDRCGVTGLRPTFGRVSRYGGMALSWSMDKVGPICRSAKDAALVFDAIYGLDKKDPGTTDFPFAVDFTKPVEKLRVGYLKSHFERSNNTFNQEALNTFKSLGIEMTEVNLPENIPVGAQRIILMSEAAAAFDELTRSSQDSLLVSQHAYAWPNLFRTARTIPAVEYINANRIRQHLIQRVYESLKDFDVVIVPTFSGDQLLTTNLTGNPCVVFPAGFTDKGNPVSISLIGNLYEEGKLLELANAFQEATKYEDQHPKFFRNE